jgi:DNA-binding MarR family transcriptional regulator
VTRLTARRRGLLEALDREGRRTGSAGSLHGRAIADRAGIHGTDFECLDVLDWAGPITAGELARHVGITSGAVTGVIDRLERLGFVRRTSDPRDRRRVIVELQLLDDERREQMEELLTPLQEDMTAINDRFDDDQLATVLEWLRSANDAVDRSTRRLRER